MVAEAHALKDVVYPAIQAHHTEVAIEGDNLIVIQALKAISTFHGKFPILLKMFTHGFGKVYKLPLLIRFKKQTW